MNDNAIRVDTKSPERQGDVRMFHFVVEYNRRTHECRLTEFATIKAAMQRRLELEKQRVDRDIEICALSTNSLAGLTRTHNRYFSRGYTLVFAETGETISVHGPVALAL